MKAVGDGKASVLAEHLCPKYRALMEWSPEKFITQASEMHEDIEQYIRKILEVKKYPEQAHKTCSGILNLAYRLGVDRLIAA